MKLEEIKNGNLNNVFKMKNDNSEYIIRSSEFNNDFEVYILKELEKNNVNSPRLKTSFQFENRYVMIYDYIIGSNPHTYDEDFFKKLIIEIKKIHNLKISYIKDNSNSESIEKLRLYYDCVKNSLFLSEDIELIKSIVLELENNLELDLFPQTIIHSDIKKENVLVNNKKVYLIDFGNCYFGNRLIDLIRLIMWFFIREENYNFDEITKVINLYFDKYNTITKIEIDKIELLIKYCLIYNLLKDIYLNQIGFLPKEYVTSNSIRWLDILKNKKILNKIKGVFENVKGPTK